MAEPARLLVSACLLGDRVRWDGGHRRDPFVADVLGRFVEWVRVCPEVACGLPVPRPALRLVGDPAAPRLVTGRTGEDHTARMVGFTQARLRELSALELCGFVCKKDSPSCGLERVKVYDGRGGVRRSGAGLFTAALRDAFPHMPVEDEGRLHDAALREAFVERVYCLRRWHDLVRGGRTRGRLVAFHADHKLLLLAHGRVGHQALGRLVAGAGRLRPADLYDRYLALFTAALARPATRARTTDVLQHAAGHLKRRLDAGDRAELREEIERYRRGETPLAVPVTLLRHHVRRLGDGYLARQVFLTPFPAEMGLRNHT